MKHLDFLKLIKENWVLVIAMATMVGWVYLQDYRLEKVEAYVAKYPSKDYFELKFKTVDDSIQEIKNKLDFHIGQKGE